MNNISFQGHSTLILSPKKYDAASEAATRIGRHLSEKSKCRLSNGKIFTSEADASKLAVLVRNEKDGILKHISINDTNIEDTLNNIAKSIDTLKQKAKGKLTAWIIGGDAIDGINGDRTVKTLNKAADVLCDRPDIDTSILVGSKSGDDRIFLHTFNGELEVGLDKNPKPLHNMKAPIEEKMEKYFDIVELNNTDVKLD